MPKIAGDHLDMAPKSTAYGLLYAAFGIGAVIGALSVGTVFTTASKARLTRIGLVLFAVLLTIFGTLRSAAVAYPVVLALGTVYFLVVTSLSTMLQQDLDDAVRGKVMALWIMGFGGTVPFGGLAGGLAHRADLDRGRAGSAAAPSPSRSPRCSTTSGRRAPPRRRRAHRRHRPG